MILFSACMAASGASAAQSVSDVRDFGAVGDGVADDTAAVQRAIDAGGIVHFPPGVYLISSIYMRSDGGLDLDDAATLRMHPDRSRWDVRPECGKYKSNNAHLVNCVSATNVSIRGGTIDGDWRSFYKRVYFYQCGGRRLGVPGLLCAKTRFVSIAAIPHILFHMCRQIGFALRATTNRGCLPSGFAAGTARRRFDLKVELQAIRLPFDLNIAVEQRPCCFY